MLILLAVALAIVIAAGFSVLGLFTSERGARNALLPGSGWSVAAVIGAGLLVAALLVGAVGIIGVGSRGDNDDSSEPEAEGRPSPASTVASTRPTPSSPAAPQAAGDDLDAGPGLGPTVEMEAAHPGADLTFPPSYPVADELAPASVLRVHVRGFPSFARATVKQCLAATSTCGNRFPVIFDEDGQAFFQYLVSERFTPSSSPNRCRAGDAPCSLVVEDEDGGTRAEVQTLFVDAAPKPGRIQVTPSTGLAEGQLATVEVRDYPPGARVTAMLCSPPDARGPRRCGAPGPTATLTVGRDGTGSTRLRVGTGPVGTEGVRCDQSVTCGVSVASDTVFTRAPVVPIVFAGPGGADLEPIQIAVGLAIGAVLLGAATLLVRRTDWSPVGEVAAPEIDDAEFADLDAIVAALPPEDDDADLLHNVE